MPAPSLSSSLRRAESTSAVASCSENILVTENINIGSKQSIRGTKEEFRAKIRNAAASVPVLL